MVPRDSAETINEKGKPIKGVDPNQDSGLMFHFEPIPENIRNMDYRMIIDGLWTVDPQNPYSISGSSGIVESRFPLPENPKTIRDAGTPGTYRFSYSASAGETITVGGTFNNWDPFMFELRETSPGFYTLTLPIPPGSFQYLFYHRGAKVPDPANPKRLYTREGNIVSEAIMP
jgi:hypothetical protein